MSSRIFLIVAGAFTFLTGAVVPARAAGLEYTILMSGRSKGALTVLDDPSGTRKIKWSYEDRGRGPDLSETRRVDAKGIPTELTIDGKDYRKAPIAERFSVAGGKATWQSDADRGEGAAGGFYLASKSSSEDLAALARALLASGGTLDLLPTGRAHISRVLSKRFTGSGQTIEATLYRISGLDLGLTSVWLDPQRELFAGGGSWMGMIRRGFESAQPEVLAAQAKVAADEEAAQAKYLTQRPRGPVAIEHATLFDSQTRALRANTTVLVKGNRIVSVGVDGQVAVPRDARIIDATGKTLLPGMWDMHVHLLDDSDGLAQLMAGITTVRDLGNEAPRRDSIMAKYDSGELPGPHVLKALLIDSSGPLAVPSGVTADTPEEMRRLIDRAAKEGYVQIKLYSSLKPELVPVAVKAAHEHGLRVSGHIPAGMSMREAVEAGYDEVQHAYFWFLNFMPREIQAKTNSPIRFSAVGEHGYELDLNSAQVRDFVRLIVERHTVLDPTLVAFESMFIGEKGKDFPVMAPWASRMPVSALRAGRVGGRGTTPELKAAYTASFENVKRMLKLFYDAGVPIVPGTDGSGLDYSHELELYVESGIPAKDVLYEATLGSARVMKQDAIVGSIEPGKRADLVLIAGNPLERMSDIRRTRLIMKDGVIFDAAALAEAVGLAPESGTDTAVMSEKPLHYGVKAKISPAAGTLSGDVTITIPSDKPIDETFVLSRRFTLHDATVGGPATLRVGRTDKPLADLHALHVQSDGVSTRPIVLRVKYEGPLSDADDPKDTIPPTQAIELSAEQMWYPVEKHINQRFTVDADISGIPESMVTVSQGDVVHRGDHVRIHRSLPDVDFALVACLGFKHLSDPGIDTYARNIDDPLILLYRKHAIGATSYFTKLFGPTHLYPLRIVAVPRVSNEHAYARVAYIVVAEPKITAAELSKVPESRPARHVAHEVAHMWWLRADAQSEDNWLNESLAEYSSLRYVESVFGVSAREALMEKYPESAALSGSILGHGRPAAKAVYARGPLLLFGLERSIGRDKMDRFLAELAGRPTMNTASALQTLSEVAGSAVADEFEAKLRATEYRP